MGGLHKQNNNVLLQACVRRVRDKLKRARLSISYELRFTLNWIVSMRIDGLQKQNNTFLLPAAVVAGVFEFEQLQCKDLRRYTLPA